MEHLFAGFMRDHLNSEQVEIIDISPMGCRTGFYMSLIDRLQQKKLSKLDGINGRCRYKIPDVSAIPELNEYQWALTKSIL